MKHFGKIILLSPPLGEIRKIFLTRKLHFRFPIRKRLNRWTVPLFKMHPRGTHDFHYTDKKAFDAVRVPTRGPLKHFGKIILLSPPLGENRKIFWTRKLHFRFPY